MKESLSKSYKAYDVLLQFSVFYRYMYFIMSTTDNGTQIEILTPSSWEFFIFAVQ